MLLIAILGCTTTGWGTADSPPDLLVERALNFNSDGESVSPLNAFVDRANRLVVSVTIYTWNTDTSRSQILILNPDGSVAQSISAPVIEADPGPVPFLWTCEAEFGDGSFLVLSDSLLGRQHIRVLPNGRIDSANSEFPAGPVITQPDGSVIVGKAAGDADALSLLSRYTVVRSLDQSRWVIQADGAFAETVRQGSESGVSCHGLVAAGDGRVWSWVVKGSLSFTNTARLARWLPDGHPDPAFKPDRPIETVATLSDFGQPLWWLNPLPHGGALVRTTGPDGTTTLLRLDEAGSGVPAFAQPWPGGSDLWAPLSTLNDGSLLANVWQQGGGATLIRLRPDGGIDDRFQSQLPVGYLGALLAQSDGKILAFQYRKFGGFGWPFVRLNADGSLDPTYQIAGPGAVPGFRILADHLREGRFYRLEESTDLRHWQERSEFVMPAQQRQPFEIARDSAPADNPHQFWRLVELPHR